MSVNLSLFAGAGWQFFDNAGIPLAGGKIYAYAAGTTTPQATYTTSIGNIQNSNPIILNAYGRVPNEIWLTQGQSYKFVLADSTDATIGTYDNIDGANDITNALAGIYANFADTTDVAKGDALVGYKQSNSSGALAGAVGRTVHQKFQEMISVKDFGATGDGVTDDSAALQAAITAAAGATLYFPEGVYYYTSLLTISNPMTITGDGYGTQLKPNTPSGNNIRINSSNVLVEKIRMEGSSPGGFAIGATGLVTNVTFQNCFFKSIGQVIWLFTANDVTVQTCVFDTTGYGVIQQAGYVSNFVLVDNNIAKNMDADFVEANCASSAPSEGWTITNNIFEGSSGYPTPATEKRFVGITSVKNVIISGNNVQKSAGDAAIHLEDTLGETIISNNIFDNCVQSGGNSGYIYILNNAENCVIEGNLFYRTNASLGGAYALDVTSGNYSAQIQFLNNRLVGNGSTGNFGGILLKFLNGKFICSNNMFISLVSAIPHRNSNDVVIIGNIFNACGGGIIIEASGASDAGENWLISNNQFNGTTGSNDITATENPSGTNPPRKWTIIGNTLSKDIYLSGNSPAASDITVSNNVFQGTATLTTSGSFTRLTRFGNVFQNSANNVTPTIFGLPDYANDAAAAAGNVIIGGLYRNGSVIQVRVT